MDKPSQQQDRPPTQSQATQLHSQGHGANNDTPDGGAPIPTTAGANTGSPTGDAPTSAAAGANTGSSTGNTPTQPGGTPDQASPSGGGRPAQVKDKATKPPENNIPKQPSVGEDDHSMHQHRRFSTRSNRSANSLHSHNTNPLLTSI